MPENEPSSGAAELLPDEAETYQAKRISRREALKRFGVIAGGVSLLSFGLFESTPAAGERLETMDDPATNSEASSSEVSKCIWNPTSSKDSCDCSRVTGSSDTYYPSKWVFSSSSSWSFWWVIVS